MTFKAKLRKIGNSQGIYISKDVITGYNIGDVITLTLEGKKDKQVITSDTSPKKVITGKKWVFNTSTGINEFK